HSCEVGSSQACSKTNCQRRSACDDGSHAEGTLDESRKAAQNVGGAPVAQCAFHNRLVPRTAPAKKFVSATKGNPASRFWRTRAAIDASISSGCLGQRLGTART